jgi:hypothetical protein
LELKTSGRILGGKMALFWSGKPHDTPAMAKLKRDYDAIERAAAIARHAVWTQDFLALAEAVRQSSAMQKGEGMPPLPGDVDYAGPISISEYGPLAWKYCGGGHGGYAVYLFPDAEARNRACGEPGFRAIEPYVALR